MPEENTAWTPYAFGLMTDGGPVPVREASMNDVAAEPTDDGERRLYERIEAMSGTITLGLEEFGDALAALGNVNHATAEGLRRLSSVMFEHEAALTYRHRYVWQYRLERKGDRSKRRTRRREVVRSATVLHDVVVRESYGGEGDSTKLEFAAVGI